MFIDNVNLKLCSGKGGAGASSFRREKFVIKGGPDGGDGGKGGNINFVVSLSCHTLANFRGLRTLKAKNGNPGETRKKSGRMGEELNILVPPGTQVLDAETKEVLLDLTEDDEKVKFLEGGKGGLGNWHFKKATNQAPTYCQPGLKGECRDVRLELKLIADVGLVGFPNVGKSTLISRLSNARPEIANYEFTTLTPNLGVVDIDYLNSFVMADIPGIIGGASDGKGLGIQFLKHIERTNFLLFMLDIAHYETLLTQYETLQNEVKRFSEKLSGSKFAIAITRVDIFDNDINNEKIEEFLTQINLKNSTKNIYKFNENLKYFYQENEFEGQLDYSKSLFVTPISSVTNVNIDPIKYALNDYLRD